MSLRYTFDESIAGFRRNRAASIITIFTVSISLLLLGVFALITVNFGAMVESIRSRVEVEVFLKDGLTVEQQKQAGAQLRAIPGVGSATYISKDEAARIFQKEFGESYTDLLDSNPLPASWRLTIKEESNTPEGIAEIKRRAEKIKAVDDVAYRKQFLTLLDKRARAFRWATLFIGIVLGLSAVILVANTIRLAIEAKREIIRTMKLVGATSMFIRLPFLIEGALHGLIGGAVAAVLLNIAFAFFIRPLSEDLLVSIQISLMFDLFLAGVGALLGLVGSVVSIRRFLREALVSSP